MNANTVNAGGSLQDMFVINNNYYMVYILTVVTP